MLACKLSKDVRFKVMQRAKRDCIWFVDFFGWTFDPRRDAKPHHLPFLLYEYQRETIQNILDHIERGEPLLIDKSRDMGASWMLIAVAVWGFLFEDGFTTFMGSRKEDFVDNRTMDSFFGRAEYFLERLPGWMMPSGWNKSKHRTHLKIENPENGNYIAGESANENFGRAGRYTLMIFDEFAFWPFAERAWAASSESAQCRVPISTPDGMENHFGRLRWQQEGEIDVMTLLWKLHPKKDEAWYAEKLRTLPPDVVAREIDISYQSTIEGLVYPTWTHAVKGNYPYQNGWPLYISWDFGVSDDTAMIWWQIDPASDEMRMIDCYNNRGKPIDFYIPLVTGSIPRSNEYEYSMAELEQIATHSTWGRPTNFGDPAGRQRSQTDALSIVDVLAEKGIYIKTNTKAVDHLTRRTLTQQMIPKLVVNLPACARVDHAMNNARYAERKDGSTATRGVTAPVHDNTSHYRSSVEYFAVNIHNPFEMVKRPAPTKRVLSFDKR